MDYKAIIDQIEKMAQVVAPKAPGGVKAPSPSTISSPKIPGKSFVGVGLSEVKNMQLAMQELAQNVMQDAGAATMPFKTKDVIVGPASEPVKSSKKAFNDFIAEQYVGSLGEDKKGVEWSTSSTATKYPIKKETQTDIYELDVVMDTLRRIGGEQSELKADGIWDFRTDNALKNIMGFTYALLQLEGDFGLSNNIYNHAKWNDLHKLLTGYDLTNGIVNLSPEDKKSRALKITAHLGLISKLYNHFRQQVTAKPEFRPFIEGMKNFDKYSGKGTSVLTTAEEQYADSDAKIDGISYVAPKLPGHKLDYIPLKSLKSKTDYMNWMLNVAGVPSEEMATKIFKTIIKPKIEAM